MASRRAILTGFGNLLLGAGAVAVGASPTARTRPSGDFRILPDAFRGLELRPGRDDAAYVVTDGDGLVTEIVLTTPGGHGLSKGAVTRFENIVEIHKLPPGPPVDEIYFEFEVVDEGLQGSDPTPAEIQDALFIAAADGDISGDGSQNYLDATDEADAHNDLLSPNQYVPFGIGIDLMAPEIEDLPDPDRFSVRLDIRAEHLPQGPPGGGGQP